jgi:hypothetical protein
LSVEQLSGSTTAAKDLFDSDALGGGGTANNYSMKAAGN